mgnify:CR=1 FL=1
MSGAVDEQEVSAIEHSTAGESGDDVDAFTDLYRRYARRVYAYARVRSTPDVAEDVVADTFLTAWRLHETIPADPLPWLLVVARNALLNRYRSGARHARLAVRMAAVEHLAGGHATHPAAEDTAVDRTAVLDALATLTDDERDAVLLTAWDGLTHTDAARVAGCSARTILARLRRARRALNAALTDRPETRAESLHPQENPT